MHLVLGRTDVLDNHDCGFWDGVGLSQGGSSDFVLLCCHIWCPCSLKITEQNPLGSSFGTLSLSPLDFKGRCDEVLGEGGERVP